jgi:hypothetical protein
MKGTLTILALSSLLSLSTVSSAEMMYKPVESFMFQAPLSKGKHENFTSSGVLKNWNTENSAVFLKSRLVLTPQSFDKSGLLYNSEVRNRT